MKSRQLFFVQCVMASVVIAILLGFYSPVSADDFNLEVTVGPFTYTVTSEICVFVGGPDVSTDVTVDGVDVQPGDVVGAFVDADYITYPPPWVAPGDPSVNDLCIGAFEIETAGYLASFSAYGDDISEDSPPWPNPPVKDGAGNMETVYFKIYKASTGKVLYADATGVTMWLSKVTNWIGLAATSGISADVSGTKKDDFICENVYGQATLGLKASTSYPVYVVSHRSSWPDGISIPSPVSGSVTSFTTDASLGDRGNMPAGTLLYGSPVGGDYDIVVDVNSDGIFNVMIDYVDDSVHVASQPTITVTIGSHGDVSPGTGQVDCEATPTYTIEPDPCYEIATVEVDGSSVMSNVSIDGSGVGTYTFDPVYADHELSVTFAIITYTITATAGDHGSISPSGTVTVNCGDDQTFNITPDACYNVLEVEVDGAPQGAITSYTFSDVQDDHTIHATFVMAPSLTITSSAGPNGSISPLGDTSVPCGADQPYNIVADSCYHIEDVVVDGTTSVLGDMLGDTYTFVNVTANHTIHATFAIDVFTIAASASTGGTISPSGNVSVNCGSNQMFDITPDPCYEILEIKVDGSPIILTTSLPVGDPEQYEFTNVTADHTIEATFTPITFTITAAAGTGGSVSPSGAVTVNCGDEPTFTITTDPCFSIADVVVDGTTSVLGELVGNTYTFPVVQADHSLDVSFDPAGPSTITATAGNHGSISPLGETSVDCGSDQTYTITPDDCYHIADVLVDDVSVMDDVSIHYLTGIGTYIFTSVQADHTIHATFAIDTFTINPFAGDHGSIDPPDSVIVDCGGSQTFTMTPDPCYHIASVAVDEESVEVTIDPETGIGTYTFTDVRSMHTIEVYFAIDTFTITSTAGPNGSISPLGDTTVDCGSDQPYTITPDPCYHIADVVVDGGTSVLGELVDGIYTFTNVQADHTIHATFAIDTFTITATAGPNGSISPLGDTTLNCGTDQAYTITPDDCYHILDVVVDGTTSVLGELVDGVYTFTNVQADHTIYATFAIDTFTITSTAGNNGSISPLGDATVNCGGDQVYTIAPDDCYHILDVVVDGTTSVLGQLVDNTYTFTDVRANHTIHATFAIDTFTITSTAGSNGSISPLGDSTVDCGTDQAYTITPDDCYHILDVVVDGTTSVLSELVGNTYTFTDVRADHTIHATFAIDTFTITATAGDNGSIGPSGDVTVNCGADQAFTVTPDTDYHVDDVLVDGVSVGAVSAYTFTNVRTGHTIHATFERDAHTITATAGPGGSIAPSGDVEVPHKTDQAFTITPDDCYHILDVVVDGTTSVLDELVDDTYYTFTDVQEAHTIHATFAIDTFTITVSAGSGGLVSPSVNVTVNCGDDQTFIITPNDCYHIADVLVDSASVMGIEGGVVINETTGVGTLTLENITANHAVAVTFARTVYTIAATAGAGGSISPSGDVSVNCRADQRFTITPDSCYHIVDVLVDGVSIGAVSAYSFEKTRADHTIEATFAIDTHTITATAAANGSITPSGGMTLDCGSDQTYTIAPDLCYHIANVLVDGVSVGAVATYTFADIQDDHTIEASFAINTYTIVATSGIHGNISPSGTLVVNCGASQTFTMMPDNNYHVLNVTVDGVSIGAVSGYTFANVQANHMIYVAFEVDPVAVVSAAYDLIDTTLTLTFDKPIDPELMCYDAVGMEVEDSGRWDFALSRERDVYPEETSSSTVITTDINRDHATTVNLAVAVLVNHQKVDLLLGKAAVTDIYGAKNLVVTGANNVEIQMVTHGYNLGRLGDVSGDGFVSAYDAALILQYSVKGDDALPIAGVAKSLSLWFAAYGKNIDVAEEAADMDDDGIVSAFDATMALLQSAGLAAPALDSGAKTCKLIIENYHDGKLDVSIDLDDVRNVYSADVVMTYDSQALRVTDVSSASAVSDWMSADAAESGKLKIALAGTSQPTSNGSLVRVTFDGTRDAVKQLDIAEFKLNGGRMKVTVENLPKSFALLQNYPNPFNPETWIPYQLSEPADVTITIYNSSGQMVRRLELGSRMPDHYVDKSKAAYWDGRNEYGEMVSSGIYFYQLQAGRDASVRKMIILK